MMQAASVSRASWKTALERTVAPLTGGAQSLKVNGWRPAGREQQRPRRTAAVLVAILDGETPQLVLTKRAQHLNQHAGQVAFPGGSVDESDQSGVRTALREAEEEIGLDPSRAEVLGFLDRIDTVSDFRVLPVVALIPAGTVFVPDHNEVESVFTLPLERALDLAAWAPTRIHRRGATRTIHSMRWDGHVIWGVTAGILRNLAERYRLLGQSADAAQSS